MDASPLATSPGAALSVERPGAQLLRMTYWSAAAMVLVLCVFVAARRLGGGLQRPLPAAGLVAAGVLAAVVVSCLRVAERLVPERHPKRWRFGTSLLVPALAVMLLAASLSLPGSAPLALVIFWLTLFGEETAWWFWTLGPWSRRQSHARTDLAQQADPPAETVVVDEPTRAKSLTIEQVADGLSAEVTQQFTRTHAPDGGERMAGLARGDFRAGERSQNLHIAFCPPMNGRPDVTVHQLAGPAVTIKPAQVESYGARLELRLAEKTDQAKSVVIGFEAHFPGPQCRPMPQD